MTTDPKLPKHRVRVREGAIRVLSLDDPAMQYCLDVEVLPAGRGHWWIIGDRIALERIRLRYVDRQLPDEWDQPSWYARSARAAHARITAVLAKLGEGA